MSPMEAKMITQRQFGEIDGQPVRLFTLTRDTGLRVEVSEFGAAVTSILTPDRNGVLDDIVLGYPNLEGYVSDPYYFGATLGRCSNRITGTDLSLGEKSVHLSRNEGAFHLHGGVRGFNKHCWHGTPAGEHTVVFQRLSPDGEEGYPGNLQVSVSYTLTEDSLVIVYTGVCDRDTILSLSNHSYFQLSGQGSGKDVRSQELTVFADFFTEIDTDCACTGAILPLTELGCVPREATRLGEVLASDRSQLVLGSGLNHTVFVKHRDRPTAELYDPESGRVLEVTTTQPGLHLYSGNYLPEVTGKGHYVPYGAMCFETQTPPNAVLFPHFPSPVLPAGTLYQQRTEYRFSVRDGCM